mgnify:CR=1 FL=1
MEKINAYEFIDETLGQEGGRFVFNECPNPLLVELNQQASSLISSLCHYAHSEHYTKKPRDVLFEFVASDDFRLFSFVTPQNAEPPVDCFCITATVYPSLLDIFGRMLSHPQVFPDLGKASHEEVERSYFPTLRRSIVRHGVCVPITKTRRIFAATLAELALEILVFHELSHLAVGHIDFKNFISGRNSPHTSGSLEGQNVTYHALEMDADCRSVLLTLNRLLRRMHSVERVPLVRNVPPDHEILCAEAAALYACANRERAVKTLIFVIYVLFRMHFKGVWDPENPTKEQHQDMVLRQTWVKATLWEIFNTRPEYQYDPMKFAREDAEVTHYAEVACGKILATEPNFDYLLSTIKPEVKNKHETYMFNVKEEWSRIRPFLESYKRVSETLPP